jgi:pimeloyl-ACP methyl ester carboxylesterase
MATFVLVHGAWLWASAWNQVADQLIANGHRVVTPGLTGLGERSAQLSKSVDLNTHIADVVTRLDEDELSAVVLVGHGYGGMIISGVAAVRRQRLAQLVFLDAYVSSNGKSAWDLIPAPLQQAFLKDARDDGDGWRLPPKERYYVAWGLPPGPLRDLVRAHATDFSLPCLQAPAPLANPLALPRAFIRGTRKYAAQHLFSSFAERARSDGWPIYEIDAGHVAYIEKPLALVEILCRIAHLACGEKT